MKRARFPVRIKRGSSVVTIYRTPAKGYDSFTVVHYDAAGERRRKTFSTYEKAHAAAKGVASSLLVGKPDVLMLTGQDLLIYQRAKEALQPVGVSLDTAVIQFAASVQALGTPAALETVVQTHVRSSSVQPKLVADVVKELLESKADKGRSELYRRDLRVRLNRVVAAFPRPLGDVTPKDIEDYLRSLEVSARTRNNFRAVIGTLFRFGQLRGYVRKDHPGVDAVEKSSTTPAEVRVFTPEEMKALLRRAKPELVPALAIGGFAGVRSEELKRMCWEHVNLMESYIEIKSADSKTKTRRLIPIQSNLKAWLAAHVKTTGRITPFSNLALQYAKLSRIAGVRWVKNGLRHSYISYRTAQVRNLAAVALESGNSAQVISRHYLKVVTHADARKWFGIMPLSIGNRKPTEPRLQPGNERSSDR